MRISKEFIRNLRLQFAQAVEVEYRQFYFRKSLHEYRVAILLVSLLYAFFGFLDPLTAPEHYRYFFFIRYVVVLPVLIALLLLSWLPAFGRFWQGLTFFSTLLGGLGIVGMLTIHPGNHTYYLGLMLVFAASFFFIKLRFGLASLASVLILLGFNFSMIFLTDLSAVTLVSLNGFYLSVFLICMFAAFYIELYQRQTFLLNRELDARNREMAAYNRRLEDEVEKRTLELKTAWKKAEASDRLKTAFMHNISHEIRTPLNGISGFGELIVRPDLTEREKALYLSILKTSTNRLLSTITDYIDMAQIVSDNLPATVEKADIKPLIEELAHNTAAACQANKLLFYLDDRTASAKIECHTDTHLLKKALQHLLNNAIKFTRKGSVGMEVSRQPQALVLAVTDTGIGISDEAIERIFQVFGQEETGTTRSFEGRGLGLSIARGLITALGGTLTVETEKGKGSRFEISLPAD